MHGESGDYLNWLRSLLSEVERAMEAEGIDAGVRQRVVHRVMDGEPTPELEMGGWASGTCGSGARTWAVPPANGVA